MMLVGLYETYAAAEETVADLLSAGARREDVSLVAVDVPGLAEYHQSSSRRVDSGDRIVNVSDVQGDMGLDRIRDGPLGALMGTGVVSIPGIGPALAAGPLLGAIAAAGGGASGFGLAGGLMEAGLPEQEARRYAEGVRRGGTLVSVSVPNAAPNAADEQVCRIKAVLDRHQTASTRDSRDHQAVRAANGVTRGAADEAGSAALYHEDTPVLGDTDRQHAHNGMGQEILPGPGAARVIAEKERSIPTYHNRRDRDNQDGGPDSTQVGDIAPFEFYEPQFHAHCELTQAGGAGSYQDNLPAYRYGYELGASTRYRQLAWEEVADEVRPDWELRHPGLPWERNVDVVRASWNITCGRPWRGELDSAS